MRSTVARGARVSRSSRIYFVLFVSFAAGASIAFAAPPTVAFDLPAVAECRDVTPDEFAATYPDERWIEVRLPLSVFLTGRETELNAIQIDWHLETPHAEIVDYSPRTVLTDRFAGAVEVLQTAENVGGAGLTVSGVEAQIKATGSAEASRKEARTVKYQEIPPKEIVTAAGTIRRGKGVHFEMRPTAATTVQGSHEFSAIVRVPAGWRGEVLYVACEASARQETGFPGTPFDSGSTVVSAGSARFQTALYLAGDEEAKIAARRVADAEAQLRSRMSDASRHVARKAAPTVLHRLGHALELSEPRVPSDWQAKLLASPEQIKRVEFRRALPPDLVEAGEIYWLAKENLARLR